MGDEDGQDDGQDDDVAGGGDGEDDRGAGGAQPEGAERGERAGASGYVRVRWFQEQLGQTSTT